MTCCSYIIFPLEFRLLQKPNPTPASFPKVSSCPKKETKSRGSLLAAAFSYFPRAKRGHALTECLLEVHLESVHVDPPGLACGGFMCNHFAGGSLSRKSQRLWRNSRHCVCVCMGVWVDVGGGGAVLAKLSRVPLF